MDKVIEKAYKLKNAMDIDPRFIKLNDIEKKMENDPEAMRLTYIKDSKETIYNALLEKEHIRFNKQQKSFNDQASHIKQFLQVQINYMEKNL